MPLPGLRGAPARGLARTQPPPPPPASHSVPVKRLGREINSQVELKPEKKMKGRFSEGKPQPATRRAAGEAWEAGAPGGSGARGARPRSAERSALFQAEYGEAAGVSGQKNVRATASSEKGNAIDWRAAVGSVVKGARSGGQRVAGATADALGGRGLSPRFATHFPTAFLWGPAPHSAVQENRGAVDRKPGSRPGRVGTRHAAGHGSRW